MSEEAAFLDALKANPADDTTRLVYADWLDEHGEAAKAEYLRVVTRVPCRGNDIDTASAEAARANELGAELPEEWKETAAGRFDVVLLQFTDKIRSMKRVRELFGISLREVITIVELVPNRLLPRIPIDSALSYVSWLSDNTGMSLAIRPSERHGASRAVIYQVIATCHLYQYAGRGWEAYGTDPQRDAEALAALTRLVAGVLDISFEEARARVTKPDFVLADELTFPAAKRLLERCSPFYVGESRFETSCYIAADLRTIP